MTTKEHVFSYRTWVSAHFGPNRLCSRRPLGLHAIPHTTLHCQCNYKSSPQQVTLKERFWFLPFEATNCSQSMSTTDRHLFNEWFADIDTEIKHVTKYAHPFFVCKNQKSNTHNLTAFITTKIINLNMITTYICITIFWFICFYTQWLRSEEG